MTEKNIVQKERTHDCAPALRDIASRLKDIDKRTERICTRLEEQYTILREILESSRDDRHGYWYGPE